jgi:hypothetical protein
MLEVAAISRVQDANDIVRKISRSGLVEGVPNN